MWRKITDGLLFAWHYVRHPLRNASVTPSSRVSARAMLAGIDFSKVQTVVELGPGTGVFTAEILQQCRPGTKVILIEINERYVDLLRKRFQDRVILEHASVSHLDAIVAKHGGKADLIVSGLPVFIPNVTEDLLRSIKRYTETGTTYRFFSYFPPLVARVYRSLPVRRHSFVLFNVPALWVYGIN